MTYVNPNFVSTLYFFSLGANSSGLTSAVAFNYYNNTPDNSAKLANSSAIVLLSPEAVEVLLSKLTVEPLLMSQLIQIFCLTRNLIKDWKNYLLVMVMVYKLHISLMNLFCYIILFMFLILLKIF